MFERVAFRSLVLVICGLLVCSCGTTGRKKGLEELQALSLYAGVVTHESPEGSVVIVVLLDAASGSPATYSVADHRGRFDILRPSGDYRFLAYVDLNADFQWNEGEPWVQSATPAVDVAERPGDTAANAIVVPRSVSGAPPVNVDLTARALPSGEEIRRAALGRVVSIDDPVLGPEVGLTSLWQPIEFLKGKNAGVFLLDEYDESKIPVILINGIGGSPSELRTIAERIDSARFQPVFLTYPSGLPIELNSWWLSRLAVEIRARRNVGDTIIIAHSMGGLVARSMINRMVRDGGPLPLAFISISTPWGGHESSSERGARIAAVPVWADLVPDSAFVSGLYDSRLPDDLHYYLLFGYSGGSAMVRGSDDGTVTISSMLDYRAQDQSRMTFGFAESHTSILESDKVIATINRILDAEATRAQSPPKE